MKDKGSSDHIKIINIVLYILIVLVLLAFSIFNYFVFTGILLFIPILFSLIVIYLTIFFSYVLIINPIKYKIIDLIIDKEYLKIVYKDRESIYKYKDVVEYKTITNRKGDITKIIILFNLNSELLIKNRLTNEYEEIISYIEGQSHEN